MNNKGQAGLFTDESAKIILSVISIVLLVYLAFSLYGLISKNSSLEQAEASLNEIINNAKILEEGVTREVLVANPSDSYIIYYDNERKDICNSENGCLCICLYPIMDESCVNRGVCKEVQEKYIFEKEVIAGIISTPGLLEIYPPLVFSIRKDDGGIILKYTLDNLPDELMPSDEEISKSALVESLLNKNLEFEGKSYVYRDFLKEKFFIKCTNENLPQTSKEVKDASEKVANEYMNELIEGKIINEYSEIVYEVSKKKSVNSFANQYDPQEESFVSVSSIVLSYGEEGVEMGEDYVSAFSYKDVCKEGEYKGSVYILEGKYSDWRENE